MKSTEQGGHLWAVVLASADDRRFRSAAAAPAELFVPTQYRVLHEEHASPLQKALRRAAAIAPRQRICAIVAEEHSQWWQHPLWFLSASNVTVHPKRLGAAYGILVTLLKILERDPVARIVFLPSTHRVRDEMIFARSVRDAIVRIAERPDETLVLGVEPEPNDTEHACIVTGRRYGSGELDVQLLLDKPNPALSRYSSEHRVLWNSGIFAGSARVFLRSFERRWPEAVNEMRAVVRRNPRSRTFSLAVGGFDGRSSDPMFHQHLLAGTHSSLRVLRIPQCGWSDLSAAESSRDSRHGVAFSAVRALLKGPALADQHSG